MTVSTGRLALAAAIGAGGLLLTGVGVYAGLQATANNTTPEAVSSATLSLTLGDNGAGFATPIGNLVPGDVVNRYVDLANGATDAQALTIGVADATPTKLTSDATLGLQVAISSCTGTWAPTTGVCSTGAGGTTALATTSLSALRTSPATLLSNVAATTTQHLKFSLTLPSANNETTVNGTPPVGTTIQGLSASLTWTFTEGQRTATTTNS
jgi:hypothetical protein